MHIFNNNLTRFSHPFVFLLETGVYPPKKSWSIFLALKDQWDFKRLGFKAYIHIFSSYFCISIGIVNEIMTINQYSNVVTIVTFYSQYFY